MGAQNVSVTAQNASVTAHNASVTAQNASVTAHNASVTAHTASVTAHHASVTAQNASVTAQKTSETAPNVSVPSPNVSVPAQSDEFLPPSVKKVACLNIKIDLTQFGQVLIHNHQTKHIKMASLSLGLSRKSPEQLIALGNLVAGKLAPAPPNLPPLPDMAGKAAALLTATTAAGAANTAYENAKTALVTLKQARDAAADALRVVHSATAKAVESEAMGDPVKLSSSGYSLAADNSTSSEPPPKVANLSVTAGDDDGELDAIYDPAARAVNYEVQITTADPVAGPWVTNCSPTQSRCSINGLTSGQRVWVRVRGNGANGTGPWSDPATKIVP